MEPCLCDTSVRPSGCRQVSYLGVNQCDTPLRGRRTTFCEWIWTSCLPDRCAAPLGQRRGETPFPPRFQCWVQDAREASARKTVLAAAILWPSLFSIDEIGEGDGGCRAPPMLNALLTNSVRLLASHCLPPVVWLSLHLKEACGSSHPFFFRGTGQEVAQSATGQFTLVTLTEHSSTPSVVCPAWPRGSTKR